MPPISLDWKDFPIISTGAVLLMMSFPVSRSIHLSTIQLEALRLEVRKAMSEEDDLMIIRLCERCAQHVIDSRGEEKWQEPLPTFEVF